MGTTRWLVGLIGVAVMSTGCGGAVEAQPAYGPQPVTASGGVYTPQQPPSMEQQGNDRVTLMAWCGSLGGSYCSHCMPANTQVCLRAFVPSCLGSRDPNTLTQRTSSEMAQCGQALETTECSSMGGGNLPMVCRARQEQPQAYVQPPPPPPPPVQSSDPNVTLQTWCGSLARNYCGHCQPTGFSECVRNFVPSCLSGRSPTMVTNRTESEVQACGAALERTECGEIVSGQLPYECRPRSQ